MNQEVDLNPGNDLLLKTLNIKEAPFVDFGADTLQVPLPHTLDATAPGDNQYLWGDGLTQTPTFRVLVPGNYSVTVVGSSGSGCYTVASVYVDKGSYLNEYALENLDVTIYPNPVTDFLNINANLKTGEEILVEMLDISNRIMFSDIHKGYQKYEKEIDVNSLPKGVYFIRISNKEIYAVSKVVVQ